MQARYLGDVHDFAKYALLRHLHRHGLRPGLLWYLTDPALVDGQRAPNDGKHRGYLTRTAREFSGLDEPLHAWSRACEAQRASSAPRLEWVEAFLRSDAPAMAFHGNPVPVEPAQREAWLAGAVDGVVRACDLLFLDPDNGIEPPSGGSRKHACWQELRAIRARGKSAVVFQHKHRHGSFEAQTAHWLAECSRRLELEPFALRYHSGGCVALLFLPVPQHASSLREAAETFLALGWRREGHRGHMVLQELESAAR